MCFGNFQIEKKLKVSLISLECLCGQEGVANCVATKTNIFFTTLLVECASFIGLKLLFIGLKLVVIGQSADFVSNIEGKSTIITTPCLNILFFAKNVMGFEFQFFFKSQNIFCFFKPTPVIENDLKFVIWFEKIMTIKFKKVFNKEIFWNYVLLLVQIECL